MRVCVLLLLLLLLLALALVLVLLGLPQQASIYCALSGTCRGRSLNGPTTLLYPHTCMHGPDSPAGLAKRARSKPTPPWFVWCVFRSVPVENGCLDECLGQVRMRPLSCLNTPAGHAAAAVADDAPHPAPQKQGRLSRLALQAGSLAPACVSAHQGCSGG